MPGNDMPGNDMLGNDMKVFVDGRERGPLTHRQWKDARKFILLDHAASARVMDVEEAAHVRLKRGAIIGTFILGGCWIIGLVLAIIGSRDGFLGLFVGGGLAWLAIFFTHLISSPFWRRGFDERRHGLPDPGVRVNADETGLTIGERVAPWPELSLASVHLTDVEGDSTLVRLTLSGAFEGVSLDPMLIAGDDVTGVVFRRLCPEPAE
jgi:hypothetical protein